jgi:hypothetical protein
MRNWFLFFCLFPFVLSAQNDYFFFTPDDRKNIKNNSQTEWGRKIIQTLENQVKERQQHSLRVPLLEGGHLHHYFCPIHNQMFDFNWDKPSSHYCRLCEKYWENDNRFDWAWINRLHAHNLQYLTASMYLFLATEDSVYAGYIRDMLLDYASKYPTYLEHNTNRVATSLYSGRMFGQSLDEAVWASDAARAYWVAKPFLTAKEIQTIETGYLKICAQMLLQRRGGGNWQVWHNSGLTALGVALESDSIIDRALNDPQCGYRRLMELHVYDDGWWNEGSPIYHYYPLRAMLLSADAVRCRNTNLYDEKLYNMLASPAMGVYADLSFPAHNDGWYGESLVAQVRLYEIACLRYRDNLFFSNVLKQCYERTERNDPESLLNNVNVSSGKLSKKMKSLCFKDIGIAVLRSADKTVVLKYGPHGGGHGHPDKLSIAIHDGKKEILPDLGTSAYGVPDFMEWYRKTLSHNTVTIDSADQKETTGRLVEFQPSPNGGYVEATCENASPGVEISRSLRLKGNRLTDIFTATSDKEHHYDYVLILTEKVDFPCEGQAVDRGNASAYKRIAHAKKFSAHKKIVCFLENGTKIAIESLAEPDFEVITGEAPGIPPKNPEANAPFESKPTYPLIIRTHGKNMKIKSEWTIR